MTRRTSLFVLLMLLAAGTAVAAMSGTYTVKKDGTGDFTSVYAAAQALTSQKTGGNVLIEIYEGVYNDGYIYLYYVNDARPQDTITFRPASGAKVTIGNGTSSYVFYGQNTNNVKVRDMTILCSSSYGFYLASYCDGWSIERNTIRAISSGVYLSTGCDYDSIVGNDVKVSSSYGLYLYNGSYAYGLYIVNNIITGWTTYGIYAYYGYNWKILYNTILGTGSYALMQYYQYGDTIKNNIFQANFYAWYRYYGDNQPAYSNYNAFWLTYNGSGSSYTIVNQGMSYTLAQWQSFSGKDGNSLQQDPLTGGMINPHLKTGSPCINAGNAISYVTVDIDGDSRTANTPDIGADEYTSVGSAMSGTYYIKPNITAGDTYPSFYRANSALAVRGQSGSVTFEVFAGTYPEVVDLTGLLQTSYWVSYIAHLTSGTPDEVTLQASGSYGVVLKAVKRIRFRNINLMGYATYGFYLYPITSVSPFLSTDTIVIQGCNITGGSYPIYAYNYYGGSDDSIYNNVIRSASSYGIYLYGSTSYPNYRNFVAQNMILGWTTYGLYCYYQTNPKIIYNTIIGTGSYAIYGAYFYGDTLKNNILQANSYAYYRTGGDAVPAYSNYNDFWLNNGSGSSLVISSSYGAQTLASWQASSGKDPNSIQSDPLTAAPINPHLRTGSPCINAAEAWTGITTDIDGDSRTANTPDIGADEYTSVGSAMSGVYTIKQAGGGDYRSFLAAFGDIALRGFGGNVQFDVYNGTYTGVSGSSAAFNFEGIGNGANRLVIRGYPGEVVNLNCSGFSYGIRLYNNQRIHLENLRMSGATSYGVYAQSTYSNQNTTDSCALINNVINAPTGVMWYYGDGDTIAGNTINASSSYGMYVYGYSVLGQYSTRNVIDNNAVTGFTSYGIYTYYQDYLNIRGNTITGPTPVYVNYGSYDTIANNICHSTGNNYGMYIYGYSGSPYSQGFVIYNNMIDGAYYGLMMYYTNGAKLIHNSIQCSATGYYGFYDYYNYATELHDNIFANAQQYAWYKMYGDPLPASSNHNCFRLASGGTGVIYHSSYGLLDLATWKAVSLKDTSSIDAAPAFTSATNNHLQGSSPCINAGRLYTGITRDIDGDDRALNTADIGADEYFGDLAVRSIISPANPAYPIGATITPEAAFKHLGGPRQTYYVGMSIYKGAAEVYRDSVRQTTKLGDSIDVTFADWTATPGGTDYRAWAWHKFAGDLVPDNDTASHPFMVGTVDLAMSKIIVPVGSYDSALVIRPKASLKNNGTLNPGAFNVYFRFDSTPGNQVYFDSCPIASLAPGESTLATAPTDWAKPHPARSYTVTYWLGVPYDTSARNDTIKGAFTVTSKQPGWYTMNPMPAGAKPVKDGGWLTYNAGNARIYASRGQKLPDFYAYAPLGDSWAARAPWLPGIEGKLPKTGSDGCADGSGAIYATKGNNTSGFYRYDANTNTWAQKKDVPLGLSNKKVKGGTGLVWAHKGATGSPYLLKGYKNEFYKYNVAGDSWTALTPAPGAIPKWDKGSWLAYDDVNKKIYAFKAKYMEFYSYDTEKDSWSAALAPMPLLGSTGSKKAKAGGSGAFIGGGIYALKGGNTQQFFKYTIATNAWAEKDTIPKGTLKKKVNAGGDIVTAGTALYALKGNKTNELWQYVPGSGFYLPTPLPEREGVQAGKSVIEMGTSIRPNPLASDFAVLRYGLPKAGAAELVVYNVAGQRVIEQTLVAGRSGSVSLDLRHLCNGVYLVKFSSEGFESSQKLVVQR